MKFRCTSFLFLFLISYLLKGQTLKPVAFDTLTDQDLKKSSIGFYLGTEVFDKILDPMYYSTIGYKRKTNYGSYILKANINQRFNSWGSQIELDVYPKIKKGIYAYLNYGYSQSAIFPKNRFGAELYFSLPKALETSIGIRYLHFSSSETIIYTGSFGLYKGNYYVSFRPYITPISTGQVGFSVAADVRKYLKNARNYLGVVVGLGSSPELRSFGDPITHITLLNIASQYAVMSYQFTDKKELNEFKLTASFTRQEAVFDSGSYFYSFRLGLKYDISM